ncbi:uncharacterized protein LOC101735939 [Bombyx mori]|uniref:Uncharacterized protein n=1 Tax=Bombyx mori TaxID=7091 RepID=A0A8R2ALZ2_BOMMO|nr:uncharacterized protein LOC101735939 [Bombyx mori]
MVLLNPRKFRCTYRSVCEDSNSFELIIAQKKTVTLSKLIFELCKACELKKMSCIPPSAFTAGRIRETQRENRDLKMPNVDMGKKPDKYFSFTNVELPVKYNSKFMNSIWGKYNRYSPHNVKKVNDAFVSSGDFQQLPVNSSKNEPMITLPSPKLDNVWAAINVSQSH